jgi:hypothetical protein
MVGQAALKELQRKLESPAKLRKPPLYTIIRPYWIHTRPQDRGLSRKTVVKPES